MTDSTGSGSTGGASRGLRFVTVQGGKGGWRLGHGVGGKAEAGLLVWSSEGRLRHKIRPEG